MESDHHELSNKKRDQIPFRRSLVFTHVNKEHNHSTRPLARLVHQHCVVLEQPRKTYLCLPKGIGQYHVRFR